MRDKITIDWSVKVGLDSTDYDTWPDDHSPPFGRRDVDIVEVSFRLADSEVEEWDLFNLGLWEPGTGNFLFDQMIVLNNSGAQLVFFSFVADKGIGSVFSTQTIETGKIAVLPAPEPQPAASTIEIYTFIDDEPTGNVKAWFIRGEGD